MTDSAHQKLTTLLNAVENGDANAADQLLPLVYAELRALAESMLRQEKPGQTLQATALVHEAYLSITASKNTWESKRHFFYAAALAMRHHLVDRARSKNSVAHGGQHLHIGFDDILIPATEFYTNDQIEGLDAALSELADHNSRWGEVVHLRFFLGLSIKLTAELLNTSPATIKNDWKFARAWIKVRMDDSKLN